MQPGLLTKSDLLPLVEAAIAQWEASGVTEESLAALHRVDVQISELPGNELGQAGTAVIYIDQDAAGYGWFVDTTPFDDSEFAFNDATGALQAVTGSQASGRFDLLTVVFHELGHILGFDHDESDDDSETLMSATLSAGTRRLPELTNADSLFTDDAFDQLLETLETNPLGSLV